MRTSDIESAINSTSTKKEILKKSFDALQSLSSSLFSFTLQWKDIENHFSSIENSIKQQFEELKELDSSLATDQPPRSELHNLCIRMDGKGLRSLIIKDRKDIAAIRKDLGPALLSAPDPAKLVLDSLDGFVPSRKTAEGEIVGIRRTCLTLLECLHELAVEIKPVERERAKGVAIEWRKLVGDAKGDSSLLVLGVLHLVAAFGLVDSFEVEDVLDLVVQVARRRSIVDLCRSAVLEENIPNLVDKLNNNGKQLEAVKFVIAFNLMDKYPPASLLKAYLEESEKAAKELRDKGNNSLQSKNEASSKEIAALKAVAKVVEEYNLGSVFDCENLQKRIEQLEIRKAEKKPEKKFVNQKTEKKPEKKRGATANAASNSNFRGQKQQHEKPNKRPRLSASAPSVHAAHPLTHIHPQLGLVDLGPHVGLSGSHALSSAPPLYNHGSASLSSNFVGHGGFPTSSRYLPSESLMDSTFYDRVATNGSYSTSGFSAPYRPPFYF